MSVAHVLVSCIHRDLHVLMTGVRVWHGQWQGQAINAMTDAGARPFNPTGVSIDTLKRIGMACLRLPQGFVAHDNILQVPPAFLPYRAGFTLYSKDNLCAKPSIG
jgi:hypothetical protein